MYDNAHIVWFAVRTGHFWFNSHSHYLTVMIHDWRMECAHRSRATPSIPGKKIPIINFLIRDALFSGNKLQSWRVGGRKYTKHHVWPPIITIIIIIMGDKICSFKLICSKCHRVNAALPLFPIVSMNSHFPNFYRNLEFGLLNILHVMLTQKGI